TWSVDDGELDPQTGSVLTSHGNALSQRLSRPVQLHPAALPYEIPGTGGLDLCAMGMLATLDQRAPFPRVTLAALATGLEPAQEKRNHGIQHARRPVADIHLAIGENPQQGAYVPGKPVRANSLALDDPGIAEGGFPSRFATVHQRDPV